MTPTTSRRAKRTPLLVLTSVLSVATVTACAPGSGSTTTAPTVKPSNAVTTDAAAMGKVELIVWDQEVRGGQNAQMSQLIKGFEAKYPNIKIKRVSRSFDDLKTTLRLALTGKDAPDVVQSNNGRSDMGEFVKAGQLLPLDTYAQVYGWDKRYPESVRQYSSYSADGKKFGTGNLYGLPQVGEVVGVFANTKKMASLGIETPKSWADFETALRTAKAKNEIPLQFGNLDKWPAIHILGTIQGRTTKPDDIRTLAFGRAGGSWTSPENMKAIQTMVDWADKGYFQTGFNGTGYDPAWQAFSKGSGVFLIGGTWLEADLQKAMGGDVAFLLPPPAEAGGPPVATGGTGLPFAITAKSAHPDAAAAYIDFITNADAMKVLTKTGNLPVADTSSQQVSGGLQKDVFSAFGTVVDANGLVPYLDFATPTMYDTLTASLQDLLAKKVSPEQFAAKVEKDYSAFAASGS